MERLNAKQPILPLLSMLASVATLVFGLVTAKTEHAYYFYAALFLIYLCLGYWRACLGIIPALIFTTALFAGITYLTGHNIDSTIYAVNRSFAVCFALIPGLSVSNTLFIRNLQQIKTPRIITLGMMISINFFPLLAKEMRQIREAMKTRGIASALNPRVFYRAFIVPLIVRIVNISDTLAVSVETRGFTVDKKTVATVYNPVRFKIKDGFFAVLFASAAVISVIL